MTPKEPVSNWQAFWLVFLSVAGTALLLILAGPGLPLVKSQPADWLAALGSIATAIVAGLALSAWKHPEKARREAEFLDALLDAAHAFVVDVATPIGMLKSVMMGFRGYEPSDGDDRQIRGAIAYIQKYGRDEADRLLKYIAAAEQASSRLDSLAIKGQIFQFEGYAACRNAASLLTWQLRRIQAFAHVLHSANWNWEHPEIRQHLANVLNISEDIDAYMNDNSLVVLQFVSETHKSLYGTRH